MATSPLKTKRKTEKDLANYDELNKSMVPITALRFQLAGWSKEGVTEMGLGDFLLSITQLINKEGTS